MRNRLSKIALITLVISIIILVGHNIYIIYQDLNKYQVTTLPSSGIIVINLPKGEECMTEYPVVNGVRTMFVMCYKPKMLNCLDTFSDLILLDDELYKKCNE
jgi:hypothetical protein